MIRAVAARRPGQELASLVVLLSGEGADRDLGVLFAQAARRAPQDICDLVAVLEEVAGHDHATRLLADVAGTDSESLAMVAAGLRHRGRTRQAGSLLDLAAAASSTPPQMIALVAALWSAGPSALL